MVFAHEKEMLFSAFSFASKVTCLLMLTCLNSFALPQAQEGKKACTWKGVWSLGWRVAEFQIDKLAAGKRHALRICCALALQRAESGLGSKVTSFESGHGQMEICEKWLVGRPLP